MKTTRFIGSNSVNKNALISFIFLLVSSPVIAGQIIISPSTFPGTVITYIDDSESFLLEVEGPGFSESMKSYTLDITGFWSGSIQFILDNSPSPPTSPGLDTISAIGNLRHTSNPHAGESEPSSGIDFALSLSAFDLPGPGQTESETAIAVVIHPGALPKPHNDSYSASLSATQDDFFPSQISSWAFSLEAKHIPEPSTLSLITLFGFAPLLRNVIRRKKHNKMY